MDFELNEEQELLRAGLRELLEGASDIHHVREVAYDGDARDEDLWRTLAQAGWTALTVPEAAGGSGLGFEELTIAAIEAGRAVLHVPLVTTLLAARTLARSAESPGRRALLERIGAGEITATLALRGEPTDWNGENAGVRANLDGESWVLSGELRFVPYGPQADVMLVEAATEDGSRRLLAVPSDAPGIEARALDVLDRSVRQYVVEFRDVRVEADASLSGDADASGLIDDLLDEWRALLAAESLGASEVVLDISVQYAKDRVAFGRPIGSNQAIKVRVANMAGEVERMRSAVYYAAIEVHQAKETRATAVAIAKAATAEPAVFVGTQGIHVHGGIGYTWEHDMHLFFKRLKSNELLLGDGAASRRRIAAGIL